MSSFRDDFVEADGIRMRVCFGGEGLPGAPVLVLHGFTGSIESMECVSLALAVDRAVATVDLVGHGETEAPNDLARFSMAACVDQVAAVLESVAAPPAHVLGYSMGGRVALSLALARPARVASLLLVGASPGLADPDARTARVEADEALARQIDEGGLEKFVDAWMSLPLFASQASLGEAFLAASRTQRLRGSATGLANSLRGMGTGAMPPLHQRLHEIQQPVCLVAGSRDAKFVRLAKQICHGVADGRCAVVEGVGHAAHLEDPSRFACIAHSFFTEVERAQEIRS